MPRPSVDGTIPAQAGIGLRFAHHREVIRSRPAVPWFEVHSENYMGGGPTPAILDEVRRHYPISLHGVGLSLGSAQPLSADHLARIGTLGRRLLIENPSSYLSYRHSTIPEALARFGPVPTLVEWDTDIPALGVLKVQARRAQHLLDRVRDGLSLAVAA